MTPDRIWLGSQKGESFDVDCWSATPEAMPDAEWVTMAEFVRADLIPAMIAEAVAKELDDIAAGLEENGFMAVSASSLQRRAAAIRNRKDTPPAP